MSTTELRHLINERLQPIGDVAFSSNNKRDTYDTQTLQMIKN
jgi:hypothetical protein